MFDYLKTSLISRRYDVWALVKILIFFIVINLIAYNLIDMLEEFSLLNFIILNLFLLLLLILINSRFVIFELFNLIFNFRREFLKLRRNMIVTFAVAVVIPSVIVSLLSISLINFVFRSWFDDKISNVVSESIAIGKSYKQNEIDRLKSISVSMADDIGQMYFK
ncbi:MAG TPA: hypothetical protein QKA14_01715 [Candidatus Megaira endosymbiont of Hartmannula sinica]|nr:hypothetical protein [Candidatus Megaera endosymbiont of Hartmannula sinica]